MQVLSITINLAFFLIGLTLLVLGSDYLIQAATRIAKRAGVSDLLIGLTIVAIGTSLPEIVAAFASNLAGKGDLAFANIAGSYLTNLTLVVGIGALAAPLATNHILLDRDTKIMILVVIILGIMFFNPITIGIISLFEAIFLLLLTIAYLSFLHWGRDECDTCYQFHIFVDFFIRLKFLTSIQGKLPPPPTSHTSIKQTGDEERPEEIAKISVRQTLLDVVIVLVSAITIAVGAQLVVNGAEFIAATWGIQESIVGFSLIALGTSLPEIAISINSARHGFGRLLIGNVLGSNIVNITLGLGLVPVFLPMTVNLMISGLLLGFMLSVSLIFYYVIRKDWRVTRREGSMLVFVFLILQILLIYMTQIVLV